MQMAVRVINALRIGAALLALRLQDTGVGTGAGVGTGTGGGTGTWAASQMTLTDAEPVELAEFVADRV